mgnify:CR=1 FL=1
MILHAEKIMNVYVLIMLVLVFFMHRLLIYSLSGDIFDIYFLMHLAGVMGYITTMIYFRYLNIIKSIW